VSRDDLAPDEPAIVAELVKLAELVGSGRVRRAYSDEPLDGADHEAAARAHNDCRSRGVSGSAIDFLIGGVAMRRNWAIFTTDPDFVRYAKLLDLNLYSLRLPTV
jgi:predicted nucleic acid-binding protein